MIHERPCVAVVVTVVGPTCLKIVAVPTSLAKFERQIHHSLKCTVFCLLLSTQLFQQQYATTTAFWTSSSPCCPASSPRCRTPARHAPAPPRVVPLARPVASSRSPPPLSRPSASARTRPAPGCDRALQTAAVTPHRAALQLRLTSRPPLHQRVLPRSRPRPRRRVLQVAAAATLQRSPAQL